LKTIIADEWSHGQTGAHVDEKGHEEETLQDRETNGVGKRGLQHHTMLMVTPTAVPTQLVDDRWGR